MGIVSMVMFWMFHFQEVKIPELPPRIVKVENVTRPTVKKSQVIVNTKKVTTKKVSSKLGSNCVLYARSKNPNLPTGLYTKKDKDRIAKKDGNFTPGSVLLTSEGESGHAAYIEEVKDDEICFSESNYKRGKFTTRCLPKNSSKIIGYY